MAEQQVHEIMTTSPVGLDADTAVAEAARRMRAEDMGAVLVTEGGELRGLVTDRDLVVRVLAEDWDPRTTAVRDACSTDLVSLAPEDSVDHAVEVMREHALRRVPVVAEGTVVGVVSLGDLAVERSPASALGGISSAPPNR
ncbi:CBS domain-containing protein [Streptomyces boncukensis]|uniref:CBS domain-containing protein n=1 Tax=Streptomyces boncukensis TaxID=2711219 RepID=A0A6G4X0D0_9ACTN|nr:CBS domain-containing protein [Streptomyces boncukensis]NGO70204.1 CBS domain-containing protein [Streptomyces boncukensis]